MVFLMIIITMAAIITLPRGKIDHHTTMPLIIPDLHDLIGQHTTTQLPFPIRMI